MILSTLISSAAAFISTNLDDLFLLMLLFSRADTDRDKCAILLGQSLGLGALTAVSLLGSAALNLLPSWCIGLLGLIPIILGIRQWPKNSSEKDEEVTSGSLSMLSVALLAAANGADNIGVYVPLFTGYGSLQILVLLVVFALMTALWCFLGYRLSHLPHLRRFLQKYRRIIVPIVLIALGVYILLKNLLPFLT